MRMSGVKSWYKYWTKITTTNVYRSRKKVTTAFPCLCPRQASYFTHCILLRRVLFGLWQPFQVGFVVANFRVYEYTAEWKLYYPVRRWNKACGRIFSVPTLLTSSRSFRGSSTGRVRRAYFSGRMVLRSNFPSEKSVEGNPKERQGKKGSRCWALKFRRPRVDLKAIGNLS